MKKLLSAVLMIVAVFIPVVVIAAGVCTFSKHGDTWSFSELTWTCTSDENGTVADPTITGDGYDSMYSGVIARAVFTPGTDSSAPTDAYDVKLHRVVGGTIDTTADLLGGLGADLGEATTKIDVPDTAGNAQPFRLYRDVLSPAAANVGNATSFSMQILLDNRK